MTETVNDKPSDVDGSAASLGYPPLSLRPYYQDAHCTIYHGDNREVLPTLDADSVHACVTDPPYGLSFMGKGWDHGVPGVEFWVNVLRVLKPGGHLLAFGGTRTYHRLAVAIEDAGFEVRDCIMWVYAQGFPKSLDVGKAIDKAAGAEREVVGPNPNSRPNMVRVDAAVLSPRVDAPLSAPATDAAKQWDGWGTALKPSYEPIIVARKPLEGTVAANTLKHGCGGINVDGCRIGTELLPEQKAGQAKIGTFERTDMVTPERTGRWPANLIHNGSEEVLRLFPETDGKVGMTKHGSGTNGIYGTFERSERSFTKDGQSDSGSAARFFYTAKADSSERRNSKHPTVKPLDLMRYLVRLVCPEGGIVLDPFMGSGSTIEAARAEHCKAIGMDLSAEYCGDAVERLRQGVLF